MLGSRLFALAVPFLVLSAALSARVPRSEKPRLMIADFVPAPNAYEGWEGWGQGGTQHQISGALQDLLTTAMLEKAGDRVRLMERRRFQDLLAEQKLGSSGLVDEATGVQLGKVVGCRFMIAGKITRFAYKKSGFSTGWGVAALASRIPGMGGAVASTAGDIHVSKATFTGRLDCRLIDIQTGEVLAVAHDEGTVKDVGVKVAGTGTNVQFDQELVGKIFEPVVNHVAMDLATKLAALIAEGGFNDPPPDPGAMAGLNPPPAPPAYAPPPPAYAAAPPVSGTVNLGFMMPNGTGVDTVDPQMLKALLPDSVANLGRSSQSASKTGFPGSNLKLSTAKADYTERWGGHRVELTITDFAGIQTFAYWANMEQDRETASMWKPTARRSPWRPSSRSSTAWPWTASRP